ncbi:ATP-grasp domain-containing protein [Pseudomonas japonica]|uniref:ATP-grasp domain-containing protein n=1 Tax=Pseudomonas japonica TaxID=256466 RepID=UPI002159615D|nr:ATP-grasp domain-containing protein [Pseudomonas japonica]
MPEWYPLLVGHTSKTLVLESNSDFSQALAGLEWPGYFIKDYVKSLNMGSGSLVDKPQEIAPLVKLMLQYRGQIEGGICVRRREDYLEGTEQRYFVFQGQAYSPNAKIPELVTACAQVIDSPFFSIDLALRADGELRVIELGDGQVSDRKEWGAERFVEMLARRQ